MLESRKIVFQETAVVVVGQIICIGFMFGIYALMKLFSVKVLLGGVIGGLLAVLNFFFMAVFASLAADKAEAQDVKGGQKILQLSQMGRYLIMFIVLIAIGISDSCDLIATALPLVFVRPIISVGGFFRKSGDQGK